MENKTAYLITVGEPEIDGVMADTFEETLIFVGRLIERFRSNEKFNGKYIYVTEYFSEYDENGVNTYVKHDNSFVKKYLIED